MVDTTTGANSVGTVQPDDIVSALVNYFGNAMGASASAYQSQIRQVVNDLMSKTTNWSTFTSGTYEEALQSLVETASSTIAESDIFPPRTTNYPPVTTQNITTPPPTGTGNTSEPDPNAGSGPSGNSGLSGSTTIPGSQIPYGASGQTGTSLNPQHHLGATPEYTGEDYGQAAYNPWAVESYDQYTADQMLNAVSFISNNIKGKTLIQRVMVRQGDGTPQKFIGRDLQGRPVTQDYLNANPNVRLHNGMYMTDAEFQAHPDANTGANKDTTGKNGNAGVGIDLSLGGTKDIQYWSTGSSGPVGSWDPINGYQGQSFNPFDQGGPVTNGGWSGDNPDLLYSTSTYDSQPFNFAAVFDAAAGSTYTDFNTGTRYTKEQILAGNHFFERMNGVGNDITLGQSLSQYESLIRAGYSLGEIGVKPLPKQTLTTAVGTDFSQFEKSQVGLTKTPAQDTFTAIPTQTKTDYTGNSGQ